MVERQRTLMHWPDIVTPAGIRQAYPLYSKAPPHLSWSRKAVRGLTYLDTDKGYQRQWRWERWMMQAACVTGGPPKTQFIYTYARGWEMELEGQESRGGRMRGGVRQWRISCDEEGRTELAHFVDSGEGRDWPGRRERHLGDQKAVVHHHSLDRLNMINESKKKKKSSRSSIGETLAREMAERPRALMRIKSHGGETGMRRRTVGRTWKYG